MDWRTIAFDWNQTRAFLVAAEEGSFSAAARALGLTQPTLSRQVAALEGELGVALFERVGRALTPTEAGLALLEHARAMGEAASRLSLAATGRSEAIEGQVTLTASDVMAVHRLPPALARLRQLAPGIEIEVAPSNAVRDLKRREADIAIRHVRPEQPDLYGRLIRETTAHLYASSDYLGRFGRPKRAEDLNGAEFIGFDTSGRLIDGLNERGLSLTRDNFRVVSDSGLMGWELVKRGFGVGVMVREVGETTEGVEPLLPSIVSIPVPIWLVTHRELRTNRRIRLVFDLLAETLSPERGAYSASL